ncbi:probable RNA-binding protein 19 [Culex pipiens pallens]|uniref:probable RNA-binding protein 19 n=1 Tax=Culex pipiens pallens TaxID=42434 RepID=UPI0022AA36B4|nr:probable RNA-binding protein 19 [Culex pipiens pallens]
MSRIIVKNLPNGFTESKLRDHFSRCGIVTDVQLKYTPEGKFRNFGFVGYESEEQAAKAIQHFNNTFLRTSKLSVAPCVALNEVKELKSWSKYSKKPEETKPAKESGKDKKKKTEQAPTSEDILKQRKRDPQFKEFVQVQNKAGKSVWDNQLEKDEEEDESGSEREDEEETQEHNEQSKGGKGLAKPKKERKITNLFVAKIHNIPSTTKRQDLFRFFKPIKPYSIRIPPKQKGFAYIGYKTEAELRKALLKDKSFLGGKQVKVVDFTEKDRMRGEEGSKLDKKENPKWVREKESVCSESIVETGKLFFRNLAYSVQEQDLKQLFERYGPVSEIDLPIDANTRKLKGFGTVTFLMPEHAVLAYNELNGTFFHGRMFHLLPAKVDEKERAEADEDDSGLTFKQKKEKQLKKTAQSSHNWNTLFMGENAIAEAVAKKYGKTKEEVLSSEGGTTSAAVRLALGETEIVMEMQKFLEEAGIQLDAFNGVAKSRSNAVILAKNLPAGTEPAELTERFGKFGLLGRVILPPSGVTAIIEFLDPSEAKKAFKKLAYTRFKSLPLYLEWAPENTFATEESRKNAAKSEETKKSSKTDAQTLEREEETPVEKQEEPEDDREPEEGTTLFIKNLSFQTREDAIRDMFKHVGSIYSVQVVRRKDGERNESRGYGFVQFKLRKSADTALKNMQSVRIDGRQVELSRSDRTLNTDAAGGRKATKVKKQTGTKILVRNVPFQANVKELRDLFKVFGELKSVRLPKKMVSGADESHRGFCFVDFMAEPDAKRAFETMCQSTHLYGRRLVLEWAEAEHGVEELRKRTAEQFGGSTAGQDAAKRSRKGVFDSSQVSAALGAERGGGEMEDGDDGDEDGDGF